MKHQIVGTGIGMIAAAMLLAGRGSEPEVGANAGAVDDRDQ